MQGRSPCPRSAERGTLLVLHKAQEGVQGGTLAGGSPFYLFFGFVRVRRYVGRWSLACPAIRPHFFGACPKKRCRAPKKRAYGCRHGSCSVPPASPTNSKPQHPRRLRQADLSAQSTHQPPPPSRAKMTPVHRGRSAHANGGAAKVKKRFSLAARHRFFGQAPKKWGRKAAGGNDHLPTYRRTRTKRKK